MGMISDMSTFTAGILVWIPFLLILVFLTLKLNSGDHNTGENYANMRLALIFLPFWIVEGIVMLVALGMLIFSVVRHRQGYIDTHVLQFAGEI